MKTIQITQSGGVDQLQITETELPTPQANEVLVGVQAISVNPVDFKVRQHENLLSLIYGPQRPAILGWDIAGTVVAVGKAVTQFQVNDRVFGMVNFPGAGNAYAEYVVAPADQLAHVPESIDFNAAAATTLAALTALQALEGRINSGDRVLIHAGSGGVGHFAIQMAKAMGADVITTASAKNKDLVLALGADEHIDYRSQQFETVVSDVDFVLDMFNGEILLNSVKVTKTGGTAIPLPTPEFSDVALELAQAKKASVAQSMVQSNGQDMQRLGEMLASGTVKPHVSATFPFEDMDQAHLQLESGRTVGKVVVTVNKDSK